MFLPEGHSLSAPTVHDSKPSLAFPKIARLEAKGCVYGTRTE